MLQQPTWISSTTDRNDSKNTFAGIIDRLHIGGQLSRLREPAKTEAPVWLAIKDVLESMGEIKEGGIRKMTPKPVFVLFPVYAHLPAMLKFVYAIIAHFSEGKYDVIILARIRKMEARNLRLKFASSMVKHLECQKRNKTTLATHASFGRSVGIRAVQFQQPSEDEARD